jgi:hypothetical protein
MNLDNAFSVQIHVGVDILDKGCVRDRKIMHDDGQSAEFMLVSRFLSHYDPIQ